MNFREAMEMSVPMSDYADHGKEATLRFMMQLRGQGIVDTATLSALEQIPRHVFVEPRFTEQAYDECALPIACGQTISQPGIVAMMTQALGLNGRQRVLEIGTGSGYQAAILSKACRMVYTIERHKELYEQSGQRFEALGLRNIQRRKGDGYLGWPEAAPFERIMITAATPDLPDALFEQLSPEGGIIVMPVGEESQVQNLMRLTREGGDIHQEILGPVRFVPLVKGE